MKRIALFVALFASIIGGGVIDAFAAPVATNATRSVLALPQGTALVIIEVDSSDGTPQFIVDDFLNKDALVSQFGGNNMLISRDGGTWWSGPVQLAAGGAAISFNKIRIRTSATPTIEYDKTPNPVSFPSVIEAIAGSKVVSTPVTITGIDADASTAISVSGGEYSIDGDAFTSAAGTVRLNQKVVLRATASATIGETVVVKLLFEGKSAGFDPDSFSVKTTLPAGDLVPNAFSFTAATNVSPGTAVVSDRIVVQGIDAATDISISGGEYAVNDREFVSLPGSVVLGDQIKVRLTAPTTYGTTGSATLTIGGVTAKFEAMTQSYTPVTAPAEIFVNPQTTNVQQGLAVIATAPTQPLQVSTTAPTNSVVLVTTLDPIPVISGTQTVTYTRITDDAALQVRTVDGTSSLQVTTGQFNISAPTSNTSIPVASGDGGSAVLQTTGTNTQVVAGRDGNQNVLVSVTSGPVTFSSTATGGTLPSQFTVYPGETVQTDGNGAPGQLRLGSLGQSSGQAGDFISGVPMGASGLSVPVVSGTSQRFGSLLPFLASALSSHFNLGSGATLTQNAQTGVLTLTVGGKSYRFLPIGALTVSDPTRSKTTQTRATSSSDVAANLESIVSAGLSFAVAPAVSYSDLDKVLKQVDAAATLEILADGAVLATIGGTRYAAQPTAEAIPGGAMSAGLETYNGQLALRDVGGYRQILYPAFANTDFLVNTFRSDFPTLQVGNAGQGAYNVSIPGATLKAYPDIVISTPESGKMWWIDATGKIFIRYPNSTAQGFSLQ